MKLTGTHQLAASPEAAFAALNDPAVLQAAIPGCESLQLIGPNEYSAQLKIGVASIKGKYSGKLKILDAEPPRKFTLHLEGKGGPGFVKGVSKVDLIPDGPGTRLEYVADVQVGGLIAAVGSRMIEAASRKISADFFSNFEKMLAAQKRSSVLKKQGAEREMD